MRTCLKTKYFSDVRSGFRKKIAPKLNYFKNIFFFFFHFKKLYDFKNLYVLKYEKKLHCKYKIYIKKSIISYWKENQWIFAMMKFENIFRILEQQMNITHWSLSLLIF